MARNSTARISALFRGEIHSAISSYFNPLPIAGCSIAQRSSLKSIIIPSSSFTTCTNLHHYSPRNQLKSVFSPSRAFSRSTSLLKMAAASVLVSKNDCAAVVQPEFDAIDESVDPVQRQLLEEQCIVLNDKDEVIGHDTKRNCHRVVNGDVLLHRAFSVFLFNGKGELLLQQRSKTKITFPMMWTNTCCSHPLYMEGELEESDAIGVRRAARRRLELELGIPQSSVELDDFQYLTRIHYKALSDSIWGEHEIDYILFLQKDNLHVDPNVEEIEEIRWVTFDQVVEMSKQDNVTMTPWFDLILKTDLRKWWQSLGDLEKFKDHERVHKL